MSTLDIHHIHVGSLIWMKIYLFLVLISRIQSLNDSKYFTETLTNDQTIIRKRTLMHQKRMTHDTISFSLLITTMCTTILQGLCWIRTRFINVVDIGTRIKIEHYGTYMIDIYLLKAFPCQYLPTWCKVCADGYDRMLIYWWFWPRRLYWNSNIFYLATVIFYHWNVWLGYSSLIWLIIETYIFFWVRTKCQYKVHQVALQQYVWFCVTRENILLMIWYQCIAICSYVRVGLISFIFLSVHCNLLHYSL